MDKNEEELNDIISKIKTCPNCKAVVNGDKFCHNCGMNLEEENTSENSSENTFEENANNETELPPPNSETQKELNKTITSFKVISSLFVILPIIGAIITMIWSISNGIGFRRIFNDNVIRNWRRIFVSCSNCGTYC